MTDSENPWSVPVVVAQITETGLHRDLEANASERRILAQVAGLPLQALRHDRWIDTGDLLRSRWFYAEGNPARFVRGFALCACGALKLGVCAIGIRRIKQFLQRPL